MTKSPYESKTSKYGKEDVKRASIIAEKMLAFYQKAKEHSAEDVIKADEIIRSSVIAQDMMQFYKKVDEIEALYDIPDEYKKNGYMLWLYSEKLNNPDKFFKRKINRKVVVHNHKVPRDVHLAMKIKLDLIQLEINVS